MNFKKPLRDYTAEDIAQIKEMKTLNSISYSEFLKALYDHVLNRAQLFTKDHLIAQEIANDVLIRIDKKIIEYTINGKGHFSNSVNRFVLNISKEYKRKRAIHNRKGGTNSELEFMDFEDKSSSIQDIIENLEHYKFELTRFFAEYRVSPIIAETVMLTLEGLEPKQIAERLEINVLAVEKRLSRFRALISNKNSSLEL